MNLKKACKNNRESVVEKIIRINGKPAKIVGFGNKAIKLAFVMPAKFSNKKEVVQGFVNWEDISPEFRKELQALLPEPTKKDDLEEEKDDFFDLFEA